MRKCDRNYTKNKFCYCRNRRLALWRKHSILLEKWIKQYKLGCIRQAAICTPKPLLVKLEIYDRHADIKTDRKDLPINYRRRRQKTWISHLWISIPTRNTLPAKKETSKPTKLSGFSITHQNTCPMKPIHIKNENHWSFCPNLEHKSTFKVEARI